MINRLAGYTVIEVMLFLTISAVIFVSAITVFAGRREATQFTQTMQDIQSQFRAYANQVSTNYTPDMGGLNCTVGPVVGPSARPVFTSAAVANQECILLGRAIQVIEGQDTIYAYPVFGLKTKYAGSTSTGGFPSTAEEASPQPALCDTTDASCSSLPSNWLGVEPYQIPNGFTVSKATMTTTLGKQDLLLLYSSLQNNNTTGTEIDSFSQGITFNASGDTKSDGLKTCIEAISCPTPNPLRTGIWKLCLKDSSNKMAELLVKASSTGITTSLNMDGCT